MPLAISSNALVISVSLSHPLERVFSKLPSAAIHSSIATPLARALATRVSLNVSTDAPASVRVFVSLSQSDPIASATIALRASEASLISPENVSERNVNSSLACPKSPTISSQVCVHPD